MPEIRFTDTDWKFMSKIRAAGITQEEISRLLEAPPNIKVFSSIANDIGAHAEQVRAYSSKRPG